MLVPNRAHGLARREQGPGAYLRQRGLRLGRGRGRGQPSGPALQAQGEPALNHPQYLHTTCVSAFSQS